MTGLGHALPHALPSDLAGKRGRPRFGQGFGNALRRHVDTRLGDDCGRVVAVGQDARSRTARWLIVVDFDGRGYGSGGRCAAHITDYLRTRARDGSEQQHSREHRTPAAEGAA
jgi:hypothetical protein